jgi:methylated-DNA-[protein]-cysteine S-methyltransferase
MAWTLFETKLGTCGVAWSDAGLRALQLPEATREETRARLLERTPAAGARASARETPAAVARAIALVQRHLGGEPQDFKDVPLDLSGLTPFRAEVYRALQQVPAGSTTTYGGLARAVGSAGAARAVGRAMATNPLPILVPCHRVLAADSGAGGFSAYGGLVTKEKILAAEGRRLSDAPAVHEKADRRAPPL